VNLQLLVTSLTVHFIF